MGAQNTNCTMKFIDIPEDRQREAINTVALQTGLPPSSIEKDWWVTQVLKALHTLPYAEHIAFKGGTSLSKCWNLIARFSEDGAPRRIKIGNGRGILFKHSSSGKNFAYKSELMMLVVTAMRTIGEEKITEEESNALVEHTRKVNDNDFNHDIKLAPAWVRKILIAR